MKLSKIEGDVGFTKLIIPTSKKNLVISDLVNGPEATCVFGLLEVFRNKSINQRPQTGYETALMLDVFYNQRSGDYKNWEIERTAPKNPTFVEERLEKKYGSRSDEYKNFKSEMAQLDLIRNSCPDKFYEFGKKVYGQNFRIFQTLHWTKDGVYSIYDKNAKGIGMTFNRGRLEEQLKDAETYQCVRFNPDKSIAFAPRDTIRGWRGGCSWDSFQKNGLVIATYMPKGAEILAEIGKKHFYSPSILGIDKEAGEEKTSCLYFDSFKRSITVDGANSRNPSWNVAFGVLKNKK